MRRIRDCLRLYYENNLSQSQISCSLKISRSTVQDYLSRLAIAGMLYEDCKSVTDEALEERLYRKVKDVSPNISKEMDFRYIHSELVKTGVTLQQWRKKLKVYMRQHHISGERLFVDYSGKKPHVFNRFIGGIIEVELFVICWGYSHYTYAEAQESQKIIKLKIRNPKFETG